MKNNFTQLFIAGKATVTLLVEISDDQFVYFIQRDEEWGMTYAQLPCLKIDESKDTTLQLTGFLHLQGFELSTYRELARETSVEYGLMDDAPGTKADGVCLHVRADMTDRQVVTPQGFTLELNTLEKMLKRMKGAVNSPSLARASMVQLLMERSGDIL